MPELLDAEWEDEVEERLENDYGDMPGTAQAIFFFVFFPGRSSCNSPSLSPKVAANSLVHDSGDPPSVVQPCMPGALNPTP